MLDDEQLVFVLGINGCSILSTHNATADDVLLVVLGLEVGLASGFKVTNLLFGLDGGKLLIHLSFDLSKDLKQLK